MDYKTILTPNLHDLVEQVYFSAKSGWTLIRGEEAYQHGWQYCIRMQRDKYYKEEGEESLSHAERMAKARTTLQANRDAAKLAGMSYKEYMASKEATEEAEKNNS